MGVHNHAFQSDLTRGERNDVINVIYDILCDYFHISSSQIEQVEYTKNTEHRNLQKKGVDFRLRDNTGNVWNIDVKYRDTFPKNYQFDDIGWETSHTIDKSGRTVYRYGWGIKEGCLTDLIIWVYWPIRKFILVDYDSVRQYYMNLDEQKLLQNERFRRSYTKNNQGKVLYYTWSYYLKNKEISNSIVGIYRIVGDRLRRIRKVAHIL